MKKGILFTLMFIVAISAFSQRNNRVIAKSTDREMSVEEMAKQQTDELNRVIALDSTQYQLVYLMNFADISAFRDSMKVRRELIEKNRKSGKRMERTPRSKEDIEMRLKLAEQRKQKRNESMKQILSPEQYEKYLQYEGQRQERINNRRNRRR